MVTLSTCAAVIGCASTRAPAPQGPNGAPGADAILAGCQRLAEGGGAIRYACHGFSAVADDAPADPADDPDSDVDELVAGVVKDFGPLREKLGARVRVEKSVLEVDGRAAHAAKVSADDPAKAGRYFAAGYVIVSGQRRLVCTTSGGDGMESCESAMRALLDRGTR
jgi:hypothetical protein